jgi:hypothetical protein
MGWWKVAGTEDVVGDVPLDAIGAAVSRVVAEYEAAFGRRPTKTEWEALLRTVLGNEHEPTRPMDGGTVKRVTLDVT